MKILMLNYEYPPVGGGASSVTAQLCEHLVCLGHGVDIVTMRYGNLPHAETVNGVRVFRAPSYRARPDICRTHEMATYLLGGQRLAAALARENRYDVIHAHFIIPTSPLARSIRRQTGIPYVVTCHGSDVPGYNPDRFQLAHVMLLPFWKRLVLGADRVVSPSTSLKELMLSRCPKLQVAVIPNGYNAAAFDVSRPRRKSVLLCSRLLPRKGFQYVIEALRDLSLGWQIDVVGDGPYMEDLKASAAGSKTPVVFHGWLDRNSLALRDLYETSSIFVFPSEAENFPTVLLEAMSAGMAIISSRAGGCPEVVGDAGVLIGPRDSAGIRQAVVGFVENEEMRKEMSRQAVSRVKLFGLDLVCRQYVKLYQELIDSRGDLRG